MTVMYKNHKEKLRAKRQRRKDTDKHRKMVLIREKANKPVRDNEPPYTYADEAAALGMSLLNMGMGIAKKKRMVDREVKNDNT